MSFNHLFRIAHRCRQKILVIGTYAEPGDPLFQVSGRQHSKSTETSTWNPHYGGHVDDPYLNAMRHSCTPSTMMIENYIHATKLLYPGYELTFNHFNSQREGPIVCDTCGPIQSSVCVDTKKEY